MGAALHNTVDIQACLLRALMQVCSGFIGSGAEDCSRGVLPSVLLRMISELYLLQYAPVTQGLAIEADPAAFERLVVTRPAAVKLQAPVCSVSTPVHFLQSNESTGEPFAHPIDQI